MNLIIIIIRYNDLFDCILEPQVQFLFSNIHDNNNVNYLFIARKLRNNLEKKGLQEIWQAKGNKEERKLYWAEYELVTASLHIEWPKLQYTSVNKTCNRRGPPIKEKKIKPIIKISKTLKKYLQGKEEKFTA